MLPRIKKRKENLPRRRLDSSSNSVIPQTPSDIFKRNRTLTGTTSNNLSSAGSKNGLESPRVHAHSLSRQRRKTTSVLVLVLASAAVLWVLVSHMTAYASVNVTDVSVLKPIDTSRYEKAIQDYLDANPIGRITFLLDQNALTTYVVNKLPEVSSVRISGEVGFGKTDFTVKMRAPVAGWQINSKQYYVDSKGIAFERNYFSTPAVQIVDNSGVSLLPNSTVIASRSFLSFVGQVISASKSNGLTVTQAILPVNTTRQLEIHLKEVGYPIKLTKDRTAAEQVGDMVTAIRYFASHGRSVQYIDVRVKGKAAFK
jgi:hypothetical protein